MNNKRLSVIIPVYNAENYVVECLDSILADYPEDDIEVIAVNDGSKDRSLDMLNDYADRDKRVIVIDKPNGGVSSARNEALDVARGEWLTFADADDAMLPGTIETLLQAIDQNLDADMIVGSSVLLKDGNKCQHIVFEDGIKDKPIDTLRHFALWCYALRRSIIEDANLRFDTDLAFSEDRVFLCEYALYAKKIVELRQPLYCYRIHTGQVNQTQSSFRRASHELSAAKALDRLIDRCTDDVERDAIRRHRDFTVKIALLHFGKQSHKQGEYSLFFDHYKRLGLGGMSTNKAKLYYIYRTLRTKVARLLKRGC